MRLLYFACPVCGYLCWATEEGELIECPDCRSLVRAEGLRDVED